MTETAGGALIPIGETLDQAIALSNLAPQRQCMSKKDAEAARKRLVKEMLCASVAKVLTDFEKDSRMLYGVILVSSDEEEPTELIDELLSRSHSVVYYSVPVKMSGQQNELHVFRKNAEAPLFTRKHLYGPFVSESCKLVTCVCQSMVLQAALQK